MADGKGTSVLDVLLSACSQHHSCFLYVAAGWMTLGMSFIIYNVIEKAERTLHQSKTF
jgi:hypothetical protein